MRDTRQEILDAARRLFNQRGYNGVSLQDIARSVGISKGNLSYHFQKKEGIAEALIAEGGDPLPLKTPKTIGELDLVFLDIQQVVQDNRFFFLSHAQLGQISPEIGRKQRARCREITENLEQALVSLHAAGLVRDEDYSGEYAHTAELLYFSSAYWASFSELKGAGGEENMGYRRHAWCVVHPLLTQQGRGALEKLLRL
ncbi:MAG: TetR/AcrR family transcriptional regulator [Ruminiclostridium sp.]|jgi:AcrR family transcriptional regulator|nr:TetR/AcrR family transcriptional regulator [Ruminiclostridium sp.]